MTRRRIKASRASTRENARALMEVAGAGAAGFADTFLSSVSTRLRNEADLLLQQVEEHVLVIRDRFILGTYFAVIAAMASVFLVVALLMYMVQAGLSWATSFLVAGIVLIMVAIIFYFMQRRR